MQGGPSHFIERHAWGAVVLVLGMLFAPVASAHPSYLDLVPNSDVNTCLTCHNNSAGGGGCGSPPCLNSFGNDFRSTTGGRTARRWDAWLRDRDSDGDRRTNGQELVYFGSSYTTSSTVGSNSYVTRPGYLFSRHTNECVLQAGSFGYSYAPRAYTNCFTGTGRRCTNTSSSSSTPSSSSFFGFTCGCNAGYTGNGRRQVFGGPSDPSASGCTATQCTGNPCSPGNCIERAPPSTYSCSCPSGYVSSGGACVVNNQCTANNDDCDPNATCTAIGTTNWNCTCNTGFLGVGSVFRGRGDDCEDIDECEGAPCGRRHTCIEGAPGTYSCECLAGYEEVGGTCVDIDECDLGIDDCADLAVCRNTGGGFTCTCIDGYEGPGNFCNDVDECLTPGACHPDATCTNQVGNYACGCNEGYIGDGRLVCADVDDCGTIVCGANERCVNQIGAPGICECATGFVRDDEGGCVTSCGDGNRTPGEACDDGNRDPGDGCSADCAVEPGWLCFELEGPSACAESCGDGLIQREAGEQCDDAEGNSDTEEGACRLNCQLPACGDGRLDEGEACDEGEDNGDAPDACREDCREAFCGDGVLDTGESCDPGGAVALDSVACTMCDAGMADAGLLDGGLEPMGDGGCSCRATPNRGRAGWLWLVLVGLVWRRRAHASGRGR
ncbi:MAG: EGF domain-containing protein [Sandaracinaceae bacterium]